MNPKGGNSKEDGELEGRYANYFKVGHNVFEFVFEFGQHYNAGNEQAQFHTRIVTSPFYAKALLEMLQESVKQYEQHHGVIRENGVKAFDNNGD